MPVERSTIRWNGWGHVAAPDPLKENRAAQEFIAASLGVKTLPQTLPLKLEQAKLPSSRLSGEALTKLKDRLPASTILTSDFERAFHVRGKSYHDLLHLRDGKLDGAPDAVVYPEDQDQALRLVQWADENDVAVVPYGGGSSVVGGVGPEPGSRPSIVADMTRMAAIVATDSVSFTATAQGGIYGPALEQGLAAQGLTLGHYPQSFEFSTLGGWIAARGAGQQSARYGKAEDWLVSADLVTPRGLWQVEGFPGSAAGPNLGALVAGSEGTLGLITRATFRVHAKPEVSDYRAFLVRDFEMGAACIREIAQSEAPVAMLRLSDADETHFFQAFSSAGKVKSWRDGVQARALKMMGVGEKYCLLLAGFEGGVAQTGWGHAMAQSIVRKLGGVPVGRTPAKRWYAGRFHGPYLRDPLLDRGVGVDTLETATRWSNIPRLYGAVRDALHKAMADNAAFPGARGIVMGHISHSYPDGASLYFTFIFPRLLDGGIQQWLAIKRAASDAIAFNGGTISHHHGVGTDHRSWAAKEKGALGMEVLRAVKRALDPNNIMNPGKLI